MGFLRYGGVEYELEDRLLAHVKVAVGAKLRRREACFLTWARSAREGSGRAVLWLSPDTPLAFRFAAGAPPELNEEWVRALLDGSGEPEGMVLVPEPRPTLGGAAAPRVPE